MEIDRENFSDDDSPMSNSTPHSEDDKHSEEFPQSEPERYLEESPPHVTEEAYALQQHEVYQRHVQRLRNEFTTFPFNHPINYAGIDLSEQSQRRLQAAQEAQQSDFSYSFPTPPPSKGEDDVKISSTSASKKSSHSHSNNNFNYEDQFKQVRQLYEINDDPKRKEFLDELFMFMKERGTPINRLPIMAKAVLDLYELYKLVIGRGGLVNVINKKLWQEIIKDLSLPSSITSAAFTLRTQYTKYLYPYECEKYNLSTDLELQAAIENNKRDGSRRSTSSSYHQYTPPPPPPPPQPSPHQQLQMAMASQLAASTLASVSNLGLNFAPNGGSNNQQPIEPPNNQEQQMNSLQEAQQRFFMMMLVYNQMLQNQQQQQT
ncbi:CLUMA_CG021262, isoform A [Clunio marinus]|uniref:CLUMA_CG021262, isoform A n=1 Tax=Clunio marinus TaxID=568069 RepID=A0A1J1J840_9DIPT|nr:CLUMA_CG021262, isoform A [Clunio marinus]